MSDSKSPSLDHRREPGRSGGSDPRAALPPTLRARYADLRLLGEGGMGTVYRGEDRRLGRTVALKILRLANPETSRRLLQEAKAQARVQHEHICRLYEAGEADGDPFIAMQYIDGARLDHAKERMTQPEKVEIMRKVAMALHEAHRLGLIHRDVKPGNILIETAEDGAFVPYLVDFGLAADLSQRGDTMTGTVLGTPAYMAPEQARGEVHSLDRRTDVYSLGATLFDLLAGRPPFVADHHWKVLAMVADEEPPALRSIRPGIPEDLQTIVMTCLERDPARRYQSAKAVAEDLQRFLDGDPIRARRASPAYVLWKKVVKHKLTASLGLAALVAVAVPALAWVQARRELAAQGALLRVLGEDVKDMEIYLRAVHTLPLHDIERERDIVRARLAGIERRMLEAGPLGAGPAHYALGRGHLALGEYDEARRHLESAKTAGYTSPELDFALGRALGELYREALEEARRIRNEEERGAKVREHEARYRDPALVHLRAAAARGSDFEAPQYLEGLIAFYEGKSDDALAKAREAFAKAPLMYEAKKLEGAVLYAEGSKYRHDAALDWDKMMASFGPAAKAYAAAADIARSDPAVHREECELWTQAGLSARQIGKPSQPSFDKAKAACARAVAASSRDERARAQQASTLAMIALNVRPIVDMNVRSGSVCAIFDDRRIKCWGRNENGELGLGDTDNRGDNPGELGDSLPFVDLGTGKDLVTISSGDMHTCALFTDGSVKCWGGNKEGQLGLGDANNRGDEPGEMGDNLPTVNLGTGKKAVAISARGRHSCAHLNDGSVKCWGWNDWYRVAGQLGQGDRNNRGDEPGEMGDNLPPVNLGTGKVAASVTAGILHTCAILTDRSLKCWGGNDNWAGGTLGLGDINNRGDKPGEMGDNLPAINLGTGRAAATLALGLASCALLDDGSTKCWGFNLMGHLGVGDKNDRGDNPGEMGDNLPVLNLGTGKTAKAVSTCWSHSCALLNDGTLKCWGSGDHGALGSENTAKYGDGPNEMGDNLPTVNLGTTAAITAIDTTTATSCALFKDGRIKCWGYNEFGGLGLGHTHNRGDKPGEMGDNLPFVEP